MSNNESTLAAIVKNQKIRKTLAIFNFYTEFPIFLELKANYAKGIKRYELENKLATLHISDKENKVTLEGDTVREISKHLKNIDDLKNLLAACNLKKENSLADSDREKSVDNPLESAAEKKSEVLSGPSTSGVNRFKGSIFSPLASDCYSNSEPEEEIEQVVKSMKSTPSGN